jgi:hypothetical protein
MRPLARLATELRVTGIGNLSVGVAGLAGAMLRGLEPGRAVVPFLVVAAALSLAQTIIGFGWIRRAVGSADKVPKKNAAFEEERRTLLRRCLVPLVSAVVIGVALGVEPLFASIVGGAAAGVGATDLRSSLWLGTWERESGVEVWREAVTSPVAGGRRPLYTRPLRASTLAT